MRKTDMKLIKRFLTLALISLTLLSLCPACAPDQAQGDALLTLAENGISDYRVVIASDANEEIVGLANEWIGYFQKITGITLPLVRDDEAPIRTEINIGKTDRKICKDFDISGLEEETLAYYADGSGALLLVGGSARGTAYAVFGFLEDYFGVRYYTPDFEAVPHADVLTIPAQISHRESPVFWFREMSEAGSGDGVWRVKMRLNSLQSLSSERYKRTPAYGGGIGYANWFVHTIADLAEMEVPEDKPLFNAQPCLTDPDTYATVLKNVRKYLDRYPEARIVSISQNDGTRDTMCTCENCKAILNEYGGKKSALWVWFVSRIANELKDEYPDVYFDTLAYNFTLAAPTGLEIPDNVIIRIAPAFYCLSHAYVHGGQEYDDTSERSTANFVNALSHWKELTDNRFVWAYDALFYNYMSPLPGYARLHEELRGYAQDGFMGVFVQSDESGSNGFAELRAYLCGKLLWNPNLMKGEYRALIREFLEAYYGKDAAKPLERYVWMLDTLTEQVHFNLYTSELYVIPLKTVTDEDGVVGIDYEPFLNPAKALFDEAAACEMTEEQALHLRKARTQIKYYEVQALYQLNYLGEHTNLDANYRRALNEELIADVKATGVKRVSEGLAVPDEPNPQYGPHYWNR